MMMMSGRLPGRRKTPTPNDRAPLPLWPKDPQGVDLSRCRSERTGPRAVVKHHIWKLLNFRSCAREQVRIVSKFQRRRRQRTCSQVQWSTAPVAVSIVGASVPRAVVGIEGACAVKRVGHHGTGSRLATLDARATGRRDTVSIEAHHAAGLQPRGIGRRLRARCRSEQTGPPAVGKRHIGKLLNFRSCAREQVRIVSKFQRRRRQRTCSQVQWSTAPAAVPIVGASVPRAAVRIEGACLEKDPRC